VTEGDGTFTIGQQSRTLGTYSYCIFKVSQSAYNLRLLQFINSKLKCGGIYPKDPNNRDYDYRVVGKKQLLEIVVPLFKLYPMHTIKYRRFELFLEALSLDNPYDPRFTAARALTRARLGRVPSARDRLKRSDG